MSRQDFTGIVLPSPEFELPQARHEDTGEVNIVFGGRLDRVGGPVEWGLHVEDSTQAATYRKIWLAVFGGDEKTSNCKVMGWHCCFLLYGIWDESIGATWEEVPRGERSLSESAI